MAYATPKTWSFQEVLGTDTDTQLQVYSDNLSALVERYQLANLPSLALVESGGPFSIALNQLTMVFCGRWLFYVPASASATTKIVPPNSALGDEVTLTNTYADGGGYVDLVEAVPWLAPGMVYTITGVQFAVETEGVIT